MHKTEESCFGQIGMRKHTQKCCQELALCASAFLFKSHLPLALGSATSAPWDAFFKAATPRHDASPNAAHDAATQWWQMLQQQFASVTRTAGTPAADPGPEASKPKAKRGPNERAD